MEKEKGREACITPAMHLHCTTQPEHTISLEHVNCTLDHEINIVKPIHNHSFTHHLLLVILHQAASSLGYPLARKIVCPRAATLLLKTAMYGDHTTGA